MRMWTRAVLTDFLVMVFTVTFVNLLVLSGMFSFLRMCLVLSTKRKSSNYTIAHSTGFFQLATKKQQ